MLFWHMAGLVIPADVRHIPPMSKSPFPKRLRARQIWQAAGPARRNRRRNPRFWRSPPIRLHRQRPAVRKHRAWRPAPRRGRPSATEKATRKQPPALRGVGAPIPGRAGESLTATLDALLVKPDERTDAAEAVLARQPMLGTHPLVAGTLPKYVPHRPERPEKSEGGIPFRLKSEYEPKGDQPTAIAELVEGVNRHERNQVLLGVTGSGKTFTMAHVIAATQRPALILAPNKTLAAQLYGEFKSFFPDNAVEYFVSYYDYYQPEAYVPRTDTYIEKEASINEQIDRMRHAATRSLLERDDVIIVASVSCIYGIGSVETYTAMTFAVKVGERISQRQLLADLVALQYRRNDQTSPRHVPRARRHHRTVPRPFGGPRLALLAVRRRDRKHHRIRSAHRPEGRRAEVGQDLLPTRTT